MKQYSTPALSLYGSIADCTFATPGSEYTPIEQKPPAPYICSSPQAGSGERGTKNTTPLLCDKYGEYSHS
jgi:hypothetical protein